MEGSDLLASRYLNPNSSYFDGFVIAKLLGNEVRWLCKKITGCARDNLMSGDACLIVSRIGGAEVASAAMRLHESTTQSE